MLGGVGAVVLREQRRERKLSRDTAVSEGSEQCVPEPLCWVTLHESSKHTGEVGGTILEGGFHRNCLKL